jgi:protein-disulfide isomerase
MPATPIRTAAIALVAVLALSACGKNADTDSPPSSKTAIANVAPPAGQQWSDVVAVTEAGGYRMGNPDAPLKLVEYGSLSCPHCAKLAQEGEEELINKYVDSGRVSWEFRSFAIHPQDVPLTVLAQCGDKSTFFPLVKQIYTNFESMSEVYNDKERLARAEAAGQMPPAQRFVAIADALGYLDFFAQRGISVDQGKSCLADTARAQKIADFANQYSSQGIESTPTLVLNGSRLDVTEWPGLQAALERAGAR